LQDTITLASYAKVNFTLDVLSPRPDGYHNMASVLQTVSLADTITLTRRAEPGITLECDTPGVPSDHTNLAYRAAEATLNEAGSPAGVHIQLIKRTPSQAGLGGGSSNAAYTLLGMNALLGLGIPDKRLMEIAATLGSDVPFFLVGGTASARGRGESLSPLPDGPPLWFVIVKPEVNVSTAWAYKALDSIPDRISARATRRMEETIREGDVERIISRMTNDFEQAIYSEHLPIALLHDEFMMARALNARLCGSGAAVFGVARDEKSANEVARIMRLKYPEVHVCRSLTREESLTLGPGIAS
jgi:4-diphosphocytidyl-2-C-methyl-D-erythritol kinase